MILKKISLKEEPGKSELGFRELKLCQLKTSENNICGATFETKELLEEHVNTVHLNGIPSKIILPKPVPLKKNYLFCPLTTNEGSICEAPCENRQQLEDHVNTVHLNSKPKKCDSCEMSFATNLALTEHYETVHNPG